MASKQNVPTPKLESHIFSACEWERITHGSHIARVGSQFSPPCIFQYLTSVGMTHGFILEFASQEDLNYYLLEDSVHAEFSRKAHPLIEDSLVVDISDGVLFGPTPQKPYGHNGLWKGVCHCGECKWEVQSAEELKHVLCHCDTCKKLGGGPFSCNYIVPRGSLRILIGDLGVYSYKGASGKKLLLSEIAGRQLHSNQF